MNLGERLKKLRLQKGISQTELAKHFNIARSTLSQYESNIRTPSDEIKLKFAEYFNVSVDFLLGRETNEPENNTAGINIPKEYTDKYKVTSRDKKQYLEEMKKANEAFFMNDELNDEAKKEMLDLMSELFWEAKTMNKRKK